MTTLLVSSVILLIGTYALNGLSLVSILSTVTTILFCGRKIGYYTTLEKIVPIECIGIFLTYILRIMMHKFVMWKFLITLGLRFTLIMILWYDITYFVYIKEERKHQ